jgi:hypothetical protein
MWKLIFSEVTNIGTGCNRESEFGEFSRDLAPSECAWFNVYPERYKWNGTTIEEIPGYMEAKEKEAAYTKKKADLLAERKFRNNEAPFMCNGVKYVNDELNIQGVKVQILDKPKTDKLPTFVGTPVEGSWKAFNDSFIPFTNESFMNTLCETYFSMRSHNFTNHGMLESSLYYLYTDPQSSVEDINDFDITVGWSPASVV